jgi:hypothetical protein
MMRRDPERKRRQAAVRQRRHRSRLKAGMLMVARVPISAAVLETLVEGGWEGDDTDPEAVAEAITELLENLLPVRVTP